MGLRVPYLTAPTSRLHPLASSFRTVALLAAIGGVFFWVAGLSVFWLFQGPAGGPIGQGPSAQMGPRWPQPAPLRVGLEKRFSAACRPQPHWSAAGGGIPPASDQQRRLSRPHSTTHFKPGRRAMSSNLLSPACALPPGRFPPTARPGRAGSNCSALWTVWALRRIRPSWVGNPTPCWPPLADSAASVVAGRPCSCCWRFATALAATPESPPPRRPSSAEPNPAQRGAPEWLRGRLARHFNAIARAPLNSEQERGPRLLAGIAHDIKTPLDPPALAAVFCGCRPVAEGRQQGGRDLDGSRADHRPVLLFARWRQLKRAAVGRFLLHEVLASLAAATRPALRCGTMDLRPPVTASIQRFPWARAGRQSRRTSPSAMAKPPVLLRLLPLAEGWLRVADLDRGQASRRPAFPRALMPFPASALARAPWSLWIGSGDAPNGWPARTGAS